jgi:single-stranded DNA-binding protein
MMNEVKISGVFDRAPETKSIDRPTGTVELSVGSLNYMAKRGDKEIKMWIDVEAVGQKAFDLADIPLNADVTITGRIERAAWQDKQTGEWRSKHFIRYEDSEYAAAVATAPATEILDDIPF